MLTKHLWLEVRLVKGTRWEVVDIGYAADKHVPAPPLYVVVRLHGYTDILCSSLDRYAGCVPNAPVQATWSSSGHAEEGTPCAGPSCLAILYWAFAMHKSQGQTLARAVVGLGKREACTNFAFVC